MSKQQLGSMGVGGFLLSMGLINLEIDELFGRSFMLFMAFVLLIGVSVEILMLLGFF